MRLNIERVKERYGERGVSAAIELRSMFPKELVDWIASLWDGNIGGFYYATSAKVTDGFLPDSESTMQAVGMLRTLGLIADYSELPRGMCKKMGNFARELQDPNGYFYHPQWKEMMLADPERYNSRRGRDLGQCVWLVKTIAGLETKYPTAYENIRNYSSSDGAKEGIPEHLRSREAFLRYLDELDVNTSSYPKAHRISSQADQIVAAGLGQVCIDYLASKQNPENGTWEKEVNYSSINGVTKMSAAFYGLGAPLPNADVAFRSTLSVALSTSRGSGITYIYNPIGVMEQMLTDFGKCGQKDTLEESQKALFEHGVELMEITADKLRPFYKPNESAFSYGTAGSSPTSQAVPTSLGLPEGDVNAESLAIGTMRRVYDLLSLNVGKCFNQEDGREFFAKIGETE